MSWRKDFDPESTSWSEAADYWRRCAYIRFYLKIDPRTLTYEEHAEYFAMAKFIIETQSKNVPLVNFG